MHKFPLLVDDMFMSVVNDIITRNTYRRYCTSPIDILTASELVINFAEWNITLPSVSTRRAEAKTNSGSLEEIFSSRKVIRR